MCCILEILSVIYGIMTLVRGKFSVSRTREVRGTPAYVVGVILLCTIPVALVLGVLLNLDAFMQPGGPQPVQWGKFEWRTALPDIIAVVGCWGTALIIAHVKAGPKADDRRRYADDEYDDYVDDRPRRRARDEYDDEDDPPRRRRADDYDDEDDRPRRDRRYDDSGEDEDRPRRRDDLDDRAR